MIQETKKKDHEKISSLKHHINNDKAMKELLKNGDEEPSLDGLVDLTIKYFKLLVKTHSVRLSMSVFLIPVPFQKEKNVRYQITKGR